MPDGVDDADSLPSVLRTKRTIALLRICVLAVVTVLYLSSVGVRRAPRLSRNAGTGASTFLRNVVARTASSIRASSTAL